jgi:hypothetical protein
MDIDDPRLRDLVETVNVMIETPADKKYTLEFASEHIYDVEEVTHQCATGSLTGAFYIKEGGSGGRFGVSIVGLDPISMSTTKTTSVATASNRVNVGDSLIFAPPANSSSADLVMTIKTKKA